MGCSVCNDYRLEIDIASIVEDFADLKIKIALPEGTPNVEAREDIKISDIAPIVRSGTESGSAELLNRRWSWSGQGGKPVYNFRSEGREFGSHRCLILADGFYEFTKPTDPKQKRKTKWLFTLRDHPWFCIAGIWRAAPEGEAFAMLTIDPGEDVAPYHNRQIVPLTRDQWSTWLDPAIPAREILQPLPKGNLSVTQVYPRPSAQAALL